jgi:hypothetical protein
MFIVFFSQGKEAYMNDSLDLTHHGEVKMRIYPSRFLVLPEG